MIHNKSEMKTRHVVKRNGQREKVQMGKIEERIVNLSGGLEDVDPSLVAQLTVAKLYDGVHTSDLDIIASSVAYESIGESSEYGNLASRLLMSNIHKSTPKKFSETMDLINKHLPGITSEVHYRFIKTYEDQLNGFIIDSNDYMFDVLGIQTLELSYFQKITVVEKDASGNTVYTTRDGHIVNTNTPGFTMQGERALYADGDKPPMQVFPKTVRKNIDRPQYIFMRVAIALYMEENPADVTVMLENIKRCYKLLSTKKFIHATPTLFNSCTRNQQLASCYLLGSEDSIEGIMKTLTDASKISKWAGGVGICESMIRASGSRIKGTNGLSNGLPRQLKIMNECALTWNQGGKRKGAFAYYLEPWHGDILAVLEMRLPIGDDSHRARDLFSALWIPELFSQRVAADAYWSLFSEDSAPGLSLVYDGMPVCTECEWCENPDYDMLVQQGVLIAKYSNSGRCAECRFVGRRVFTDLYTRYENEGRALDVVKAVYLNDKICAAQTGTGIPYAMYKDTVNRTSNQQNIGTIRGSNLCTEIVEYTNHKSYATCTLASMNLMKFIKGGDFDFESFHKCVKIAVYNLDKVITINKYPVPECEQNAYDYRPIGLGFQGLANVFMEKRIPFLSKEAEKLDLQITECMYHAALEASTELAEKYGPYAKFQGSPTSKGLLHFDLWMENQRWIGGPLSGTTIADLCSGKYDWNEMRERVKRVGIRNSLMLCLMPTVSTSQISGNNESFEPIHANIYTKDTLSGKLLMLNTQMVTHLKELGLWSEAMYSTIKMNNGSVQHIATIPQDVKEIYKTVWEMSQIEIMKRAALRAAFIDQSSSLNIHLESNDIKYYRSVLKYGHLLGLPTGSYYIRSRPGAETMKTNMSEYLNTKAETPKRACEEGCESCAL